MELYYTPFYVTSALVAAMIIVKTYLFLSQSHFHHVTDWLRFSKYNIYTSRNNKEAKAKQTQNTLSVILLIFTIIDLSFLLMAHLA